MERGVRVVEGERIGARRGEAEQRGKGKQD